MIAALSGHALLRVGQMALANDAWQGRQIVPADWLKRSTKPVVSISGDGRYGWHWYLIDFPVGTPTDAVHAIAGIGWGGQRLHIVPSLNLAVVMSAGNYQQPGREQAHRLGSHERGRAAKSSPRRMRLCIGWQACTPRSICWLP